MKQVLIIPTNSLGYEGITSVIQNYLIHMDLTDLSIDVLTSEDTPDALFQNFSKFSKVLVVPNRKRKAMEYMRHLDTLMKKKYDIVHVHGNSGTMMIETLLAKKNHIKKIIVHCHANRCDHMILNVVMREIMKLTATDFLACSKAAGNWLYRNASYTVINNAIDVDKFQYTKSTRKEVRHELGLQYEVLIGHIGHFTPPKNHFFLVDIFKAYHEINSNSKLLLIGDGTVYDSVKNKVERDGLKDSVIFTGRRNDCDRLYQTMDLFLLPSKIESFGIVTLEAQAAGLPCLVSDVVPIETKCSDRIFYQSLEDTPQTWAEMINKIVLRNYDRNTKVSEKIKENGYDIFEESKKVRNLYLN
ncbi:glycosyltransferase [Hungatella sp.]|uniref:glycosyltransferase n=1 Tax=Hungatella sp. TaxID=2613924 RepID=UPI002A812BFF|nr:glycosyltransferase [Hungatella sp.]